MRKSSLPRLSVSGPPQRVQDSQEQRGTKRHSSKERQNSGAFGFGSQSQTGRSSSISSSRQSTTVRRSSYAPKLKGAAGSMRASGIGLRGRTDIPKDPRPLNDKKFLRGLIRQLLEFLVTNNYPHVTSEKLLQAPSSKEFFKIFEFIYGRLSPGYKMGPKMEEEMPKVVKMLGYPFTISKMHLFSVGSPHVWPNLCGVLTWMIDLIEAANHVIQDAGIDSVIFHNQFEDEEGQEQKLFFDYTEKAYKAFMEGFDTYEDLNAELETILTQQYQPADVDNLLEQNCRMVQELELHEEKQDQLVRMQEKLNSEQRDLLQYHKHLEELQQYKKSLAAKLKSLEEDSTILHAEVQKEKHHLENVREMYENQEMTASDVEHLKGEQEQMKRQIKEFELQDEVINEDIFKQNIETAKISEKTAIEVAAYNRLAVDLQLIPSSAENANGQDYSLVIHHKANIPQTVEQVIKPKLMQMKKQCAEEIRRNYKQKYQQTYKLERLQESIGECKDKLNQKKEELSRLESDIESLKQLSQKENRSNSSEKNRLGEIFVTYEAQIKQAEESKNMTEFDYLKVQKELESKKTETERKIEELEEEKLKVYEEVDKHKKALRAKMTMIVEHLRKVDTQMDTRLAKAEQEAVRRNKWLEVKRQELSALQQCLSLNEEN